MYIFDSSADYQSVFPQMTLEWLSKEMVNSNEVMQPESSITSSSSKTPLKFSLKRAFLKSV
jgi:hypothetical protein